LIIEIEKITTGFFFIKLIWVYIICKCFSLNNIYFVKFSIFLTGFSTTKSCNVFCILSIGIETVGVVGWLPSATVKSNFCKVKSINYLHWKNKMNKMNCELMLTYDTPALRQTGSRNLTGQKTLPTFSQQLLMAEIWYLVTSFI
jgi:hypothetical protein